MLFPSHNNKLKILDESFNEKNVHSNSVPIYRILRCRFHNISPRLQELINYNI